jgi:hypothetical protein
MKKEILVRVFTIGFIFAGVMSASAAAENVLELQNVTVAQCDEPWVQDGVTLSFVNTTAEDCDGGGTCYFGLNPEEVWLFPARLHLDFSGLSCTVTAAEIDVVDNCGAGCSKAFLYAGGSTLDSTANRVVTIPETLSLASTTAADSMAVSSCEGMVQEIRLTCQAAGWAPASVVAAEQEPASDMTNGLFLLIVPVGAVLLWKARNRRK